ncbi:phytosulfokines-like [Cucurbita pepo subsp. pepo]|uniref:phytosulfokines-like n=1 Tax=Cucurbita pepo subsp. pepo TaxID=3664 RepID=UPI000C9D5392|nr:phytosulfokines-like [Cucurbita pepo subsp. pepo]
MSKLAALFTIAALLTMSSEARPIATLTATSAVIANPVVAEEVRKDGPCEGREKDDCLIRRTLEAHTDYIYSGDTKP